MSFQDVGASSSSYRRPSSGLGGFTPSSSSGGASGGIAATGVSRRPGAGVSGGSNSAANGGIGHGSGNGNGAPTVLREALLQYQQQVTLYEKLGREVGGPRDDAELRAQLRAQEAVVKEVGSRLEQQVGQQLRGADTATAPALGKAEKDRLRAEANKMSKDAQRLRARFDNLARQTAGRVREADLRARREEAALSGALAEAEAASIGGGQQQHQRQRQQQQQQQQQQQRLLHEELDEGLLREREAELLQINQSVVKVNEIFRDLGELVARQQEDIDSIEQNVERSHAAARSGLEQVEKAAKHQAGCVIA